MVQVIGLTYKDINELNNKLKEFHKEKCKEWDIINVQILQEQEQYPSNKALVIIKKR